MLIVLELAADTSRTKLTTSLKDAGFMPGSVWVKRAAGDARISALVEVEGLLEDNDPRLSAIAGLDAPAVVIGGYAVPLSENL